MGTGLDHLFAAYAPPEDAMKVLAGREGRAHRVVKHLHMTF